MDGAEQDGEEAHVVQLSWWPATEFDGLGAFADEWWVSHASSPVRHGLHARRPQITNDAPRCPWAPLSRVGPFLLGLTPEPDWRIVHPVLATEDGRKHMAYSKEDLERLEELLTIIMSRDESLESRRERMEGIAAILERNEAEDAAKVVRKVLARLTGK